MSCRFPAAPSDALLDDMAREGAFYITKKKKQAGPMMPETKTALVDFYRPYTNELARFLEDERFAFKDTSFGW